MVYKKILKGVCFVTLLSLAYSPHLLAQEVQKKEIKDDNKHTQTLEQITKQRATLESLRLQVQIVEEQKKLEELSTVPLPTPVFGEADLLKALEIKETNNKQQAEKAKVEQEKLAAEKVLSIQGVDGKNLSATVFLDNRKMTIIHGEVYKGKKIHISKELEQVSIGTKKLYIK